MADWRAVCQLTRAQAQGSFGAMLRTKRVQDALAAWGWTLCSGERFRTSIGSIHLQVDGTRLVRQAAEASWIRSLISAESRLDEATAAVAARSWPCLSVHRQWSQAALPKHAAIAAGAGVDGRTLKWATKQDVHCECGEVNPTKYHLTWDCPIYRAQRAAHLVFCPPSEFTRKLLVWFHPRPSIRHSILPSRAAVAPLFMELLGSSVLNSTLHIASDGSSTGRFPFEIAAAAVATARGTFADRVPAVDQSAMQAELWGALLVLMGLANLSGIPPKTCLAIDNLNVVRGINALQHGCRRTFLRNRDRTGWWTVAAACLDSGIDLFAFWVPAHDRAENW